MNSSTRLTCHLVRRWKAVFGRDTPSRGLGSGHIARCIDCQRYFAADAALTQALRRNTSPLRQSAPSGFDHRVLAAIMQTAPRPVRERHVGRMVLAFGGAAAAVVLAVIPLRQRSNSAAEPSFIPSAAKIPAPTTLDPFPALNASVNAVMQKEPLQKEVDSVYADARSAVRFLEINFLPDPSQPAASNASAASGS